MAGTASSVVYLLFTILIGLIAIPICLYWTTQFYSFKEDQRFRKRHGKLSAFTALCFVGELFSGALLTLAFSGFITNPYVSAALAWIGDILNLISYFFIIHCLVLRFWCLYYDVRYQTSTSDNIWKSLLDEHYVVNEEHLSEVKSFDFEDDLWFIKNKNREGNSRWVVRVWFMRSIMFNLFMLSLLTLIAVLWGSQIGLRRGIIEVIFTCLFLVPWFLMIYIYHKIPQFFDTYSIRQEIVLIHNIDLIDVVASAVVSIVANYGIYSANASMSSGNPYKSVLEDPSLNLLMIVTFYVMGVSHCLIIYISTQWVKEKIIQDRHHINILHQRANSTQFEMISLAVILKTQYGYELFMEHLKNEFSIENLLSLTEFMQYKIMIKEALDIKPSDNDIYVELPMDFIPRSSIVYGSVDRTYIAKRSSHYAKEEEQEEVQQTEAYDEKSKEKYRKIIYKLHWKYIRSGGELEVNTSWDTRRSLEAFMDTNKKTVHEHMLLHDDEYYSIFDACIIEVIRLMKNDSYARFSHTDKYVKVKDALEVP
eukprot:14654_1